MQTIHNPFTTDFITKINEANALYKEAFLTLVPEEVRPHLITIDQECHAILTTLITSCVLNKAPSSDQEPHKTSSVKNVDIE